MVPAMDSWRHEDLPELAAALATRPGHEAVRTQVTLLLHHVFRVDYLAFDHEVRLPEVHGRADMLFGATVFEFESDLRREMDDVCGRLPDYLRAREKRELWDRLLAVVYGTAVGDDRLFLQHTYLTIVAKTIAARVLDLPLGDAPAIMSGQALAEAGIQGAVESDFFDWVLRAPEGHDLILRVARQAGRFRLREVQADVLKALYESLIDPAQRHDLGEYYTPDWLAAKLVRRVVTAPLTQRVLDPACGSGTFLFHALRRLLAAARQAGWSEAQALAACEAHDMVVRMLGKPSLRVPADVSVNQAEGCTWVQTEAYAETAEWGPVDEGRSPSCRQMDGSPCRPLRCR